MVYRVLAKADLFWAIAHTFDIFNHLASDSLIAAFIRSPITTFISISKTMCPNILCSIVGQHILLEYLILYSNLIELMKIMDSNRNRDSPINVRCSKPIKRLNQLEKYRKL